MTRKLLRNIFLTILGILVLTIVYAIATYNFVANDAPTAYSVTIQDDDWRTAYIEAEFVLQDRILLMGHLTPAQFYGPFVKNLRVTDQNGTALQVRPCAMWWVFACNRWKGWEAGRKWLIDARPGDAVTLTYEIAINHETVDGFPGGIDTSAFVTDWGIFSTGRTLFVMNGQARFPQAAAMLPWLVGRGLPAADSRQNVAVTFDLPDGWLATVPWSQSADDAQTYIARDLYDLVESMMFMGKHREVTTRQGDTEVVWVFAGDEILAEQEQLARAADSFFNHYTELMGGLPQTAEGEPFPKVAVIVTSGPLTDGEVIDRNIALVFAPGSDIYGFNELDIGTEVLQVSPIHLVAHEFFHLWNGKTIDSGAEGEWFGEGLTDYQTIRALHKFGYFDEATCFDFFREHYRLYVTNSGYGSVSIQEAGENKNTYRGLVYGGGMFVGMVLDLIIRHETANQKSIDDLMAALFEQYGGTGELFSTADVQALAEELSGVDLDDFFSRYVTGTESIPIAKYAPYAGLQAEISGSQLALARKPEMTDSERAIYRGIFGP
ncbi:MAG: hypothetical protein AAF702_51465 [Chloroflexota bacterium]